MNIHPIFVHFPIALFSVYAVCECLRFGRLRRSAGWRTVKIALLGFGVVGAVAALITGDMAGDMMGRSALIEAHGAWAAASVWIFGLLCAAYAVPDLARYFRFRWAENAFMRMVRRFEGSLLTVIAALVGLVAITVAGALGGAIVYGPDIDPVVHFIYGLVMGGA